MNQPITLTYGEHQTPLIEMSRDGVVTFKEGLTIDEAKNVILQLAQSIHKNQKLTAITDENVEKVAAAMWNTTATIKWDEFFRQHPDKKDFYLNWARAAMTALLT